MSERVLRCLCSSNGPTRRTLFGPPDPDQLQLDYTRLMKQEVQEASRRWNFDFSSDAPLPGGDYEWTEISGVGVPALYRESTRGAMPHPNGSKATSALEKDDEINAEKRHPLKRKQTNITDFYQAKRRVVATTRKSGQ